MVMALAIYTLIGCVIFFGSVYFYQTNIIYSTVIYNAAHWAMEHLPWIIAIWMFIGYSFIIQHYWSTPFEYFQEVVDATKSVYERDDQLITLSEPLSELETQLNYIKMSAIADQRAAKEAEQRKNDLVTYLAHDLKTPITSVIGYLSLLSDEENLSPEMRKHYTDIALDKAERLDDLINEFFEITRFNLSHISVDKKQINLSLMLEQLLFEFRPMLKNKHLQCQLSVQENIMLRCDPDKLQRVFDNLLKNAVSYSHPNTTIRISGEADEKEVTLVFENDGDTISAEKLDRLFDQFFRLDNSRSTVSGGAGLGLAIAKEIIELHGGTITAYSENDLIRFTVILPKSTS